jgi:hypothetical protein
MFDIGGCRPPQQCPYPAEPRVTLLPSVVGVLLAPSEAGRGGECYRRTWSTVSRRTPSTSARRPWRIRSSSWSAKASSRGITRPWPALKASLQRRMNVGRSSKYSRARTCSAARRGLRGSRAPHRESLRSDSAQSGRRRNPAGGPSRREDVCGVNRAASATWSASYAILEPFRGAVRGNPPTIDGHTVGADLEASREQR